MFYSKYKIFAHLNLLDDFFMGKKPPPITVDIEPENCCNLNCYWCYPKIQGWRDQFKGRIKKEVLLSLPRFLNDWGCKTIVITGGGEPLMHPNITEFIAEIGKTDLKIGMITNGVLLTPKMFEEINSDKIEWIGFSIDSGTKEIYKSVKGKDCFDIVIKNARYLRSKSDVNFTYKYVISTRTYMDIYEAASVAKDVGFDSIYFRPVIGLHEVFKQDELEEYMNLLDKTRTLEDNNFKVLYNIEKTNIEFKQELENTPRCIASPVLMNICADGSVFWCQDHRGEDFWKIADINNGFGDILKNWGAREHIKKVLSIVPSKHCNRCTFKSYNEILKNRGDFFTDYL